MIAQPLIFHQIVGVDSINYIISCNGFFCSISRYTVCCGKYNRKCAGNDSFDLFFHVKGLLLVHCFYLRFLLTAAIAAAAPVSIATENSSLPVAGLFSSAASTDEELPSVFTVNVSDSPNSAP